MASALLIASMPVAVINGATTWGWIVACAGLFLGLCLMPNALTRVVAPRGQVTVDMGRHLRDDDVLECPEHRRDFSFVIVIGLIVVCVFAALRGPFDEPAIPGAWVWAGWILWMGVDAVYSIDEWWQGWNVPEPGA